MNEVVKLKQEIARKKAELELLKKDIKDSNSQLSELSDYFVTMLETTDDFMFFKDANHVVKAASQTLANITHFSSWRDLIGKTDYDIFPKEHADNYCKLEKELLESLLDEHGDLPKELADKLEGLTRRFDFEQLQNLLQMPSESGGERGSWIMILFDILMVYNPLHDLRGLRNTFRIGAEATDPHLSYADPEEMPPIFLLGIPFFTSRSTRIKGREL